MRKSFRALEGSEYVTAQTLFRTSEYPNLPTLAGKVGKSGYIKHATIVRKVGGEGTEYPEPVQDVSGPGTALMELDLLCINGMSRRRPILWTGRGRRSMNLQDNRRACHGSVLVHGDHLVGLKVLPLRGIKRSQPYRGSPTGFQEGRELHPK